MGSGDSDSGVGGAGGSGEDGKQTPRKKATTKKSTTRKSTTNKSTGRKRTRKKAGQESAGKQRPSGSAAGESARDPVSGKGSVTIVVVNWNGRDLLEGCLAAALAQDHGAPFEVVVVDNMSSDDSVAFVRERFPTVRVLENTENNYAGANNLGAASSSSEFIVCLNTDTRVEPDWLRHMVSCAQSDPAIGGVTPLVVFEDGRVNSAGIEALDGFHWADRGMGHTDPGAFPTGPVEGVSGCSALYRRSCWDALGGLDMDFHMYYEDVDMSLRCRAAGWRLMLCAEAVVHHAYNASIEKRDKLEGSGERALKDDLGERNRLYVIARHFPGILGEILPISRFALFSPSEELLQGLERILAKWEAAALSPLARDQVLAMVLAARAMILDREAWARNADVNAGRAKEAFRQARHSRESLTLRYSAERERLRGQVQTLQARLASKDQEMSSARGRVQDLSQRLQQAQERARTQLDRQVAEIARLKARIGELQSAKQSAAAKADGEAGPADPAQ